MEIMREEQQRIARTHHDEVYVREHRGRPRQNVMRSLSQLMREAEEDQDRMS